MTGYEPIIEGLKLPDPDDRHVLAAAIRVGAAAIVTMNLKDFPKGAGRIRVFAIHPDDFILDLADLEPPILERVAKEQRASLLNPPLSAEGLSAAFAGKVYRALRISSKIALTSSERITAQIHRNL